MRVRIRRTRFQRRARGLLAFALLLPAAGLLQGSGINPVSVLGVLVCLAGSAAALSSAVRPILVILRPGITIPGGIGRPAVSLAWREIESLEVTPGVVSVTTRGRDLYQLQVDLRAAEFLGRMVERTILSGRA